MTGCGEVKLLVSARTCSLALVFVAGNAALVGAMHCSRLLIFLVLDDGEGSVL